MEDRSWQSLALAQCGLVTRAQLAAVGVDRWAVRTQLRAGRWVERSATVIGTTTGSLTPEELRWLAVLHAGEDALVGGLTAAELHGLRNWQRDEVTVLVPYGRGLPSRVPGVRFVRTRKVDRSWRSRRAGLPVARLEPAILLWSAAESNDRSSQAVLAAAVQQRLTTPDALSAWIDRLIPLRKAPLLRRALADLSGGAQSLAEIDFARLCRRFRIASPHRQVKRRDASGRLRFTDCEWCLADGRILVLEIDGGFHMEVEHWEDDLVRQRALSGPDRITLHATSREIRDDPEPLVRDLIRLGVPRTVRTAV